MDLYWVYLDEVKLRESLKKGEIYGVVLWQNEKMESDDFMVTYIASDVNDAASSGHAKHGNDFFYVNFAGISKEVEESSPLKAAGILRAWIQVSNMVAEDRKECLEINNVGMKGFMWMPSVKYAKDNLRSYNEVQRSIGVLCGG